MLDAKLDESTGVIHVNPSGALSEADFATLAAIAEPYIEKHGQLNGLLLQVDRFPGWENFSGMIHHFRFVREHHKKIRRVAVVTDAPIGKLAENVAGHFVAATIKNFSAAQLNDAKAWLASAETTN